MRGIDFMAASLVLVAMSLPAAAQDAGKPTPSNEELQRMQDKQYEEAKRRSEAAGMEVALDQFAIRIPHDQRVKREIIFGPNQPSVFIIVDRTLIVDAGPADDERIDVSRSILFERSQKKMVRLFDLRIGRKDDAIFTLRCASGSGEVSFCTFAGLPSSTYADYAVAGQWFVIPGNGCIYSRAGSWETFKGAGDAAGVNCLEAGALQPRAYPPTNATSETSL
jgi:hypothetical protein